MVLNSKNILVVLVVLQITAYCSAETDVKEDKPHDPPQDPAVVKLAAKYRRFLRTAENINPPKNDANNSGNAVSPGGVKMTTISVPSNVSDLLISLLKNISASQKNSGNDAKNNPPEVSGGQEKSTFLDKIIFNSIFGNENEQELEYYEDEDEDEDEDDNDDEYEYYDDAGKKYQDEAGYNELISPGLVDYNNLISPGLAELNKLINPEMDKIPKTNQINPLVGNLPFVKRSLPADLFNVVKKDIPIIKTFIKNLQPKDDNNILNLYDPILLFWSQLFGLTTNSSLKDN